MEYRAVANRCAVDIELLNLPISDQEALEMLLRSGFKILEVDLITLARQCIRTSQYCRGAKPSEAPAVLDCSSFIKWLYGMRGIWIPRRSIQQREIGAPVTIEEISKDDVIFSSGWIDYYHNDPSDGVGHVGIATGDGTIIHAANKEVNIIESPLETFIGNDKFRGIRRYVPKGHTIFTLETPILREVEISDDLRWIILQSLPKK